jgi:hypothetical protein
MNEEPLHFALAARATVRVRARGQSMRPFLPDGTEVVIAPFEGGARVGDVVLTAPLGGLSLHRVVETFVAGGRRYVRTRGDGRRAPDPPLPEERVLGRAVAVVLGGRARSLDAPLWRAVGWAAARILPRLWFLRRKS